MRVSIAQPAFDAEVNLIGTVNVLEAARQAGAQVVFSSTGGAIYGECEAPADEDSPRLPLAPYGASKLAGEEYLATWSRLYGAGHVALRYGNVYGPRQDPHGEAGVVAIFFGRIANGQELHIFGDGRQTRDYIFVADVVAATLAAGSGPAGRLQHRDGDRDVRSRARGRVQAWRAASTRRWSSTRRGSASLAAASSIRLVRRKPSAGGRQPRSTTVSRRPGTSSGRRKERAEPGRTSRPHGPSSRVRARPALASRRHDRNRDRGNRALPPPFDRLRVRGQGFLGQDRGRDGRGDQPRGTAGSQHVLPRRQARRTREAEGTAGPASARPDLRRRPERERDPRSGSDDRRQGALVPLRHHCDGERADAPSPARS